MVGDKYSVKINGSSSLAEINAEIEGEEAGASQFVDSKLSAEPGDVSNVVTFKELEPGTVPPQLKILKQSETPPAGTIKVWSGVMLVGGTTEAMTGYRKA